MTNKLSRITVAVVLLSISTAASAEGPYVGFGVIGARSLVDFGGVNTNGGFSNTDQQGEYTSGVLLAFGLQDQFALGNTTITPELDFAWYKDYDTQSASFPGLPAPTFFYDSSIETGRLGVNFWTPFHADKIWRAEAGVGFGAMYRDISTNDTVVQGQKDDYVPYGQLGVRFLRKMSDKGSLTLGTSYLFSDSTTVPLSTIGGGVPAGNLEVETDHVEITIGYQFSLGK